MTTAIIGVGKIGRALARLLVDGGEQVVIAARNESEIAEFASELGELATAGSVRQAIAKADVVVFAVKPFEAMKTLISEHGDLLDRKVVVDPSNQYLLDPNREWLPKSMRVAGCHERASVGRVTVAADLRTRREAPELSRTRFTTSDERRAQARARWPRRAPLCRACPT
jgi:predicted dinucleotide-binding enzyme